MSMMARIPILLAALTLASVVPLHAKELETKRKGPPGELSKPGWLGDEAEIVTSEEARQRVAACGLAIGDVTPRNDERSKEVVLSVRTTAVLPDEMLVCIAKTSLRTAYTVTFEGELAPRYATILDRLEKDRS